MVYMIRELASTTTTTPFYMGPFWLQMFKLREESGGTTGEESAIQS